MWRGTGVSTVAALLLSSCLLGCGGGEGWAPPAAFSGWMRVADMSYPPAEHLAQRLPDGRVVAFTRGATSLQIYDPVADRWVTTAPAPTGLGRDTATVLADGRVLVVGRRSSATDDDAAVYDPVTGLWTPTGPKVTAGVTDHTATLLPSGHVLVVGGTFRSQPDPSFPAVNVASGGAERYDPVTNLWYGAAPLRHGRQNHAAALMADGRVVVVGGYIQTVSLTDCCISVRTAEIYDPATDSWSQVAEPGPGGGGLETVALRDGRVLLGFRAFDTAYLVFDPAAGQWMDGAPLIGRFSARGCVNMPNGTVLMSSGQFVDRYDPAVNAWTRVSSEGIPRTRASATLLNSGALLILGGAAEGAQLNVAELFWP